MVNEEMRRKGLLLWLNKVEAHVCEKKDAEGEAITSGMFIDEFEVDKGNIVTLTPGELQPYVVYPFKKQIDASVLEKYEDILGEGIQSNFLNFGFGNGILYVMFKTENILVYPSPLELLGSQPNAMLLPTGLPEESYRGYAPGWYYTEDDETFTPYTEGRPGIVFNDSWLQQLQNSENAKKILNCLKELVEFPIGINKIIVYQELEH